MVRARAVGGNGGVNTAQTCRKLRVTVLGGRGGRGGVLTSEACQKMGVNPLVGGGGTGRVTFRVTWGRMLRVRSGRGKTIGVADRKGSRGGGTIGVFGRAGSSVAPSAGGSLI